MPWINQNGILKIYLSNLRRAEKRKQRNEKRENNPTTKNKMADFIHNISVITLSINDINTPIKGQRLAQWMKKYDSTIYSYVLCTLMILQ